MWRTHFKTESYSESLRQRLYKRPGFNLYEAFISCDLNDDGTVSREELRRLIESRGFYVSDKEVNQLVEKLDKDRDGRISYSEVRLAPELEYMRVGEMMKKHIKTVIPVIDSVVDENDIHDLKSPTHSNNTPIYDINTC